MLTHEKAARSILGEGEVPKCPKEMTFGYVSVLVPGIIDNLGSELPWQTTRGEDDLDYGDVTRMIW